MRTAEYYYQQYSSMTGMDEDDFTEVLNQARKEALEEAAKRAKTTWDAGHKCIESAYVDTKSILNLINELK